MCARVSATVNDLDTPLALGNVRDLSLHGAYVELMLTGEKAIAIGRETKVQLRFRPPNAEEPIEVTGVVARLIRNATAMVGLGIEFVDLAPKQYAIIADVVLADTSLETMDEVTLADDVTILIDRDGPRKD